MTARPGLGAPTGVDDNDLRRSLSALVVPGSATDPLVVRSGVFYSPGNPLMVSQNSPLGMSALVQPGVAAVHRAGQGPYFPSNDSVATVTFAAAPGANSRWDLVYINQNDASAGDANSDPGLLVVTGTAAAVPTKPYGSVPAGGLVLAEVGPVLTSTTQVTDAMIANVYVYTAVRGMPVPVRNQTERDALILFDGLQADRLDTHVLERYNGTAWLGSAIGVQATKNATQSVTAATPTIITFPTEDWDSSAFHDLVTNNSRLTVPAGLGGKYLITGKVDFTSATVPGFSILSVKKNGAALSTIMQTTLAADGSMQGSTTVLLAAGDYVELSVQVAVTSTLQSSVSDTSPCYFSAVRLGA